MDIWNTPTQRLRLSDCSYATSANGKRKRMTGRCVRYSMTSVDRRTQKVLSRWRSPKWKAQCISAVAWHSLHCRRRELTQIPSSEAVDTLKSMAGTSIEERSQLPRTGRHLYLRRLVNSNCFSLQPTSTSTRLSRSCHTCTINCSRFSSRTRTQRFRFFRTHVTQDGGPIC